MKQILLESVDKIKKIILENKFDFFSPFRKILVGGFVNQLIKKIWPKKLTKAYANSPYLDSAHAHQENVRELNQNQVQGIVENFRSCQRKVKFCQNIRLE